VPPASVVHVVAVAAAVAAGGGGTTRDPLQDFVVIDPPGIANQRKPIRHGVLFRLRQWQAQLLAAVSELHPIHLWMEIQKKKEKGNIGQSVKQMYRRNSNAVVCITNHTSPPETAQPSDCTASTRAGKNCLGTTAEGLQIVLS